MKHATPTLERLAWPKERLHACLPQLLKTRGALDCGAPKIASIETLSAWIETASRQLGCEARPLDAKLRDLKTELGSGLPCLVEITPDSYLAITGARRRRLRILAPDLRTKYVSLDAACRLLRNKAELDSHALDHLLEAAQIRGQRRSITTDILLDQQFGDRRIRGCWTFSGNPGAKTFTWLKRSGVVRNASLLLSAHLAQYLLWLAAWAVIGRLSLAGHLDHGWLLGWTLLLATVVPGRVLVTWLGGIVSVGVGAQLKRRLLEGSLRLEPEEVRHLGIGSFLAQAFEAETLERLALGGGLTGLLAVLDLAVAGILLRKLACVLIVWFAIASFAAWRFLARYQAWSSVRLDMTNDLVESMVGHRTRLAQQRPEQWHESEDASLEDYLGTSSRVDHAGTVLMAGIPRGWLLAALAFFAPTVMSGASSTAQVAIKLGGILLAYAAFDRLTSSFSELASAFVAWRRVSPLFRAAERPQSPGRLECVSRRRPDRGDLVLEADKLAFRYRDHAAPVLESCSLAVKSGDRILLEGSSGGGKTTLASLLAGIRHPGSGLLLSGGLDWHTLGAEGWRERIVAVPQFHENHLLTDTLASNLLMGRRRTPAGKDFEDAAFVCRQLGLGPLLDRMPSGLWQMVGDGGWQLSHGERSRVFIARALLQDPDLTILDESFGALDPETLEVALRFTIEKTKTLVVIAHP